MPGCALLCCAVALGPAGDAEMRRCRDAEMWLSPQPVHALSSMPPLALRPPMGSTLAGRCWALPRRGLELLVWWGSPGEGGKRAWGRCFLNNAPKEHEKFPRPGEEEGIPGRRNSLSRRLEGEISTLRRKRKTWVEFKFWAPGALLGSVLSGGLDCPHLAPRPQHGW